jgi:hypothetical protein
MLLHCSRCSATVDAKVAGSYAISDHDSMLRVHYTLSQCPTCAEPLLSSEVEDYDGTYETPVVLFPTDEGGLAGHVPESVEVSFSEARACFKAKAYTACAIMCRKALEGLCASLDVRTGSLKEKLEKLKENGLIEEQLFKWANALRLFGNDAAHDVSITIQLEDARDTLEFTRALIEYVFTYRVQFEAFEKRRAAKSAKAE